MASYSEKVLEALQEISRRDNVNLFEAASTYCEEVDIDPTELIESLDSGAVEQIKFSAISGRHVRQCVQKMPNVLL